MSAPIAPAPFVTEAEGRRGWWAAGGLTIATLLAYRNSLDGVFVFDDLPSILQNPTIERLWPLTGPLSPPVGAGLTVAGRPLVNLSLAVNRAISGVEPWSYHVFNLLVHLAAGLLLFGLVRRTLGRRAAAGARPVAFLVALLWLMHPLQTEAVTYVIQRAEAMMGLCYFATLYAFARLAESEATESTRNWRWRLAAVAACAAGMGCKEVMVTAPVAVWLYDRTFWAGGLRAALRRRPGFYAALAATWGPLAWLVAGTGGDRGGTFKLTLAAFRDQWLTQPEALTLYLARAVWPAPLIFEYGVGAPDVGRALGFGVGIGALAVATAWAWRHRPAAGFCGAMFFLVLAPTTLMPGVTQTIVEHRMYVPLAAGLALIVGLARERFGRAALAGGVGLALAAGLLTVRRNADYADALRLWEDTVAKRPQSALAQSNLATAYYERGRYEAAREHNERSLRLNPTAGQVDYNLGLALEKLGRREEALGHFAAAARRLPMMSDAFFKQGQMLTVLGRAPEAIEPLTRAVELNPLLPELQAGLGAALAESGRWAEAAAADERALELGAQGPEVAANLGAALVRLGRAQEAETQLRAALGRAPRLAAAHFNLGLLLATQGREAEARASYQEAVRLAPENAEARLNFGIALAQAGRWREAREQLAAAVALRPEWPEAHGNLGLLLCEQGELAEARRELREAVRLRPDYARAQEWLARIGPGGE